MSLTLLQGCHSFVEKALEEDYSDDKLTITQINLDTLIFGYTSIEARINELISIDKFVKKLKVSSDYLKTLKDIEQKLTIKDKYNLLAELLNIQVWNSSAEPFQAFEIIQTIRDEVIHYKGDFYPRGELPINKIKPLFDKLNLNHATEKSWQRELFGCRVFGKWIDEKIVEINKLISAEILRILA